MDKQTKAEVSRLLKKLETGDEEVTLADVLQALERIEKKIERQPVVIPQPYPVPRYPRPPYYWGDPIWVDPTIYTPNTLKCPIHEEYRITYSSHGDS